MRNQPARPADGLQRGLQAMRVVGRATHAERQATVLDPMTDYVPMGVIEATFAVRRKYLVSPGS